MHRSGVPTNKQKWHISPRKRMKKRFRWIPIFHTFSWWNCDLSLFMLSDVNLILRDKESFSELPIFRTDVPYKSQTCDSTSFITNVEINEKFKLSGNKKSMATFARKTFSKLKFRSDWIFHHNSRFFVIASALPLVYGIRPWAIAKKVKLWWKIAWKCQKFQYFWQRTQFVWI